MHAGFEVGAGDTGYSRFGPKADLHAPSTERRSLI